MMKLLLTIRLSWFFIVTFLAFFAVSLGINGVAFSPAALTLFSVNSFLYGFYIAPILGAQKNRIDELSRIIHAEANALFDILIKTKTLPRRSRTILQDLCEDYLEDSFKTRRPAQGEEEYERLISYCLEYKGKDPDTIKAILDKLISNQQNRSQLVMQLNNRVFNNEWWIMLVLFSITIGFVVCLNTPDQPVMHLVKALLCTGLTMLMLSLLKLSTLTHKRAKDIWRPLDTLTTSRFRRID